MKAILGLVFLVTLGTQSFAAELLLQYEFTPGFTPKPEFMTVEVTDDGKVIKETWVQNIKGSKKETLATLSKSVVKKIQEDIANLNLGDRLVDADPKGPECTDAPRSQVEIYVPDDLVVIQRSENCHEEAMQSKEAIHLTNIMKGLVSLGR